VLAAAGAAGLAIGLAGCTGSGPGGAGGDGTLTPESGESGGSDGSGGSGGAATATPSEEFSCDVYEPTGATAYDLTGTPSLLTFDVPEGFSRAGRYPESERFIEEIKSPIVDFHQVFVVLDQRYEPLTPEGLQDDIDQEVADQSGASGPEFAPVDAFEFGGETVDLYGTPDVPADGAVHAAWLPHETSDGTRYFKTFFGLTTSGSFYEENEDGQPELTCIETLQAINEVVLSSLAPNPETTIEEQY
jgi:hypothetical protein